jgi:hypothetical protein
MSRTVAVDVTMSCATTTTTLFIKREIVVADYAINEGTDYLIGCNSASSAINITLPLAANTENQIFFIIDETGSASTNAITITAANSNTLNGETSQIIDTNYTSVQIYSDGVNGFHIM